MAPFLRCMRWVSGTAAVAAWAALAVQAAIWRDTVQALREGPAPHLIGGDRSPRINQYEVVLGATAVTAPLAFSACRLLQRRLREPS